MAEEKLFEALKKMNEAIHENTQGCLKLISDHGEIIKGLNEREIAMATVVQNLITTVVDLKNRVEDLETAAAHAAREQSYKTGGGTW